MSLLLSLIRTDSYIVRSAWTDNLVYDYLLGDLSKMWLDWTRQITCPIYQGAVFASYMVWEKPLTKIYIMEWTMVKPLIVIFTSRKLATLVFGLTGPRCARALPAHIGLRCAQARPAAGQVRAAHGPITQLSANRPSNFYNIDAKLYCADWSQCETMKSHLSFSRLLYLNSEYCTVNTA